MLSLKQAQSIAQSAVKNGRSLNLAPLAISVVDVSGEPVCAFREDGAAPLRGGIALGKARSALCWGEPSRTLGEIASERPGFYKSLQSLSNVEIVPAAGGVAIFSDDQELVGAVGISGDLSDKDEACAVAAIHACGLRSKRESISNPR